jgi:hypothetical protein
VAQIVLAVVLAETSLLLPGFAIFHLHLFFVFYLEPILLFQNLSTDNTGFSGDGRRDRGGHVCYEAYVRKCACQCVEQFV